MKPYMEVAARSLLNRHFLALPPYSSRRRITNSACIVPQGFIDHKLDMHTEDENTAKISSRHKIQVCSFGCVIISSQSTKGLLTMHKAEETCRERTHYTTLPIQFCMESQAHGMHHADLAAVHRSTSSASGMSTQHAESNSTWYSKCSTFLQQLTLSQAERQRVGQEPYFCAQFST
jgi:hypothetical protein